MSARHLGIDFETYCELDIREVGLDVYSRHPSFKPLIASIHNYDTGQTFRFDFVRFPGDRDEFRRYLSSEGGSLFWAHNAEFEARCIEHLGAEMPVLRDSAVVARALGASSRLEFAAPQLLNLTKLDTGKALIKKFCTGPTPPTADFVRAESQDWALFREYCDVDARLSVFIGAAHGEWLNWREWKFMAITHAMNAEGWKVDLDSVSEMKRRYLENTEELLFSFRQKHDPHEELNLNSSIQLKEWCYERGIRARSFNEERVATLIDQIQKKLASSAKLTFEQIQNYEAVLQMLETKQALGGSSLKKLDVILRMTADDGRLRNSYMHIGAGATWRTSGRGVQMQNLKRIENPVDMRSLFDDTCDWSNDVLASNLRQVFTASNPNGALLVGDYRSVESRGLAFAAGENWKLAEYRQGRDLYKVLAGKIYNVDPDRVNAEQRRAGKVGELGCGYGAGPSAITGFANGMGISMTEDEAATIVHNWRKINPKIVEFWTQLNDALQHVLKHEDAFAFSAGNRISVRFEPAPDFPSLNQINPNARNVWMIVSYDGDFLFRRHLTGCYRTGRNVRYYKASNIQSGQLWHPGYQDPKTKQYRHYELYGGKLAGILTQSLCREIFFRGLEALSADVLRNPSLTIIGQFHDEVVLDFDPDKAPAGWTIENAKILVRSRMTFPIFAGFPLDMEVKSAYRYIK